MPFATTGGCGSLTASPAAVAGPVKDSHGEVFVLWHAAAMAKAAPGDLAGNPLPAFAP